MAEKSKLESSDYIHLPNNTKLDNIPGDWGLPVVGHTIEYFRDPLTWAKKAYKKHGPLVKLNAFGTKAVIPLGPDLMQQIYTDPGQNYSSKAGYQRLEKAFGTTLIAEDFSTHRHQRRIMQTAFKADSLKSYNIEINSIYDSVLQEWESDVGKTVSGAEHIQHILLLVAAKVFFGENGSDDHIAKLDKAFKDTVSGAMYLIPLSFPGSAVSRGLKGRHFLDNYFRHLLPQRRAADGRDMLSYFCREQDEQGNFYPDDEIISQMIFLMFAAHDTTAAALTNTLYYLAKNPGVKAKVYQEAKSIAKDTLDYEDLNSMVYMQQVFNEVLRLRPSVPVLPRRTVREVELAGYKLPANTCISLLNGFCHYMDEYWSDPYKFDPDRFSAERAEHKQHPFQFHPFGGGAHKCIGMHFSQMEFKCFLHKFILKFDFKAHHKPGGPKFIEIPLPRISDGMPIELTLR